MSRAINASQTPWKLPAAIFFFSVPPDLPQVKQGRRKVDGEVYFPANKRLGCEDKSYFIVENTLYLDDLEKSTRYRSRQDRDLLSVSRRKPELIVDVETETCGKFPIPSPSRPMEKLNKKLLS